jgi:transforming growth factor-beta-induced protein
LGTEVASSAITNGAIVQPLSTTNTLKLTLKANGDVFVNQAQVTTANINADNGIVHVLNAVVLPSETVVDVAIDNGFTSLTAAVVKAELLPALTNPLATLTVFAPTNTAFDNIATGLGVTVADLLNLPNLADILTYHVLGTEVASSAITNGAIVQPLSTTNTLKLTLKANGDVFVNQAQVTTANINAENGIVHVLNAVVLPSETVVDVAIDNGFTSLTAAVVKAELLPALTNPLATLTVFAPTNTAFDNLATALGTDLAGVLASPNLTEILTYHVLATEVTSNQLVNNSNVPTLNGQTVLVTTTPTVKINESNVSLADVQAQNGVVHVIDAVLLPGFADINEVTIADLNFYPNPATENISIDNFTAGNYQILNSLGQMVKSGKIENNLISVLDLESGSYIVRFTNEEGNFQGKLIKQ